MIGSCSSPRECTWIVYHTVPPSLKESVNLKKYFGYCIYILQFQSNLQTFINNNIMISECRKIEELRKQIRVSSPIGKTIGYLILCSYFIILPQMLRAIWPWLLSFDQTVMYVGTVFALNIGMFSLYNGVMYLIYHYKFPFFEQYRNTEKPWPWDGNPEEWRALLKKSLLYIAINFFVVTPIMVWVSLQASLPYSFSLNQWPSTTEIFIQFFFFLLVEDTLFYWGHRLLHHPTFYWIHKHHHEYHQTIGLASQYVHPLEYIIAGTIPSSMGFQILSFVTRVHYASILVWLIYRFIQSYEGHCGYTWSWNTLSVIPYTVGSDHHDFHHAGNCGNYGSVFLFWDSFCQTQIPFVNFLEKEKNRRQSRLRDKNK